MNYSIATVRERRGPDGKPAGPVAVIAHVTRSELDDGGPVAGFGLPADLSDAVQRGQISLRRARRMASVR